MREICTSGSEGGGTEPNRFSLPLSVQAFLGQFIAKVAPLRIMPLDQL